MKEQKKIRTIDGHEIPVIIDHADKSKFGDYLVILLHGIFTDKHEKGRFDRFAERLNKNGLDVIRFDFRGHGESPLPSRKFTPTGALLDYKTVLNLVKQQNYKPIVIGSSFGGSVVLLERLLPNRDEIEMFIFLNPVVDYQRTFINSVFEWEGAFKLKELKSLGDKEVIKKVNNFECSSNLLMELVLLKPYEGIKHLNAPSLVFHGDKDTKLSIDLTKKHFNTSDAEMVIVKGAGHSFKSEEHEKSVHNYSISWILKKIRD